MTLAIIFCFTLWTATLVFAVWWSERRYQDGYHDGYSDAEEWAQRTTSTAGDYFGGEP